MEKLRRLFRRSEGDLVVAAADELRSVARQLTRTMREFSSFDAARDPPRAAHLATQLQSQQTGLMAAVWRAVERDDAAGAHARRQYRLKFSDLTRARLAECNAGYNAQVFFRAERIRFGVDSVHQALRPLAMRLCDALEAVRVEAVHHRADMAVLARFEEAYVAFELALTVATEPVMSPHEFDSLMDVAVLFSETLALAVRERLLLPEAIEDLDPHLMMALPRLALAWGLAARFATNLLHPSPPFLFSNHAAALETLQGQLVALEDGELALVSKLIVDEDADVERAPASVRAVFRGCCEIAGAVQGERAGAIRELLDMAFNANSSTTPQSSSASPPQHAAAAATAATARSPPPAAGSAGSQCLVCRQPRALVSCTECRRPVCNSCAQVSKGRRVCNRCFALVLDGLATI